MAEILLCLVPLRTRLFSCCVRLGRLKRRGRSPEGLLLSSAPINFPFASPASSEAVARPVGLYFFSLGLVPSRFWHLEPNRPPIVSTSTRRKSDLERRSASWSGVAFSRPKWPLTWHLVAPTHRVCVLKDRYVMCYGVCFVGITIKCMHILYMGLASGSCPLRGLLAGPPLRLSYPCHIFPPLSLLVVH